MSKQKPKEKEERSEKKKEQKIIYIDDGSTVADMSGTFRGGKRPEKPRSTFREKARTFFTVMKKMVVPMLITLLVLTIMYIGFLWATGNFW